MPEKQKNKNSFTFAEFLFGIRGRTVLFLAATVLLCLGEILLAWHLHPEQGRDSIQYITLIEEWHRGGLVLLLQRWPQCWFPPLYFYLAQLFMYPGLSAECAGVWLSMICGALVPAVVFGISYEITRETRLSLASALLAAVNPTLVELSCRVQRDVPYLFFAALVLYFLLAGVRRKKWYLFLLSGGFCSAAILIRYEAAEFLLLVLLSAVISLIRKQDKWYIVLRNMFLFSAAFVLSLLFWQQTLDSDDAKMTNNYFSRWKKYSLMFFFSKSRQSPLPQASVPPGRQKKTKQEADK